MSFVIQLPAKLDGSVGRVWPASRGLIISVLKCRESKREKKNIQSSSLPAGVTSSVVSPQVGSPWLWVSGPGLVDRRTPGLWWTKTCPQEMCLWWEGLAVMSSLFLLIYFFFGLLIFTFSARLQEPTTPLCSVTRWGRTASIGWQWTRLLNSPGPRWWIVIFASCIECHWVRDWVIMEGWPTTGSWTCSKPWVIWYRTVQKE